jgi:hypothetical protein
MKASLVVCVAGLALAPLVGAEVVEEETWYSAEGKVVKTVKRTLTGAHAVSKTDWEPAWIERERVRDSQTRVSYSSPQRYRSRSYGSSYYSSYYSSYGTRYYYPRSSYRRSGFSGFLRLGSGKPHWGVGYRRPGLNALFTR